MEHANESNEPKTLPLLSYQEGRLLMDDRARRQGSESVRNISQAYRISGPLDFDALSSSVDELIRRHEALRVTLDAHELKQVVVPPAPVEVVVVETDEGRVAEFLTGAALTPFDPARAPRLKVNVLKLGEDRFVLNVVFDHLVVDGWSRGLVLKELGQLYAAFRAGEAPSPPEPSFTYSDLVAGQHTLLTGEERRPLVEYWTRRLEGAGAIPKLELPDAAWAHEDAARGGASSLEVPAAVSEAVAAFCRREKVTPFITLVAAFQCVLHGYGGRPVVPVAVNVFNRDTAAAQDLVAPLSELVVIATSFTGRPSFRDVVRQVRTLTLEAHEHAALPYGEIVKTLDPEAFGDPSLPIGAVFNMLYEQVQEEDLRLDGVTCEPMTVSEAGFRPRSVLVLTAIAAAEGFTFTAYYQADRLKDSFVEGLLDAMVMWLAEALATPDRPVTEIEADQALGPAWTRGDSNS